MLLRSESVHTDATDDSNISGNSSGSNTQDESADSFPECVDNNDTSLNDNNALLTDVSLATISVVPDGTDYIQKARDLISDNGWDFAVIVDSAKTFKDKISLLNATSHQSELRWNNKGKFTSSNLAPLLGKLTLRSKSEVHEAWSSKNNDCAILQQLIGKVGKDCTKKMAIRLHENGITYDHLHHGFQTVLWSRSSTKT